MPVLLAALSAAVFGVGDFLGGMSARRMAATLGAVVAQATGLALLVVVAAAVVHGEPTGTDLIWGAAAGLCGALALLAFYWALATGRMSVVAPVSAVMSALVPMAAGLASGEEPGPLAMLGAVVALVAIVLISREPGDPVAPDDLDHDAPPERRRAVLLAAGAAGVGFGLFFVGIARTSEASGLWPLATARGTAVVVTGAAVLVARTWRPTAPGVRLAVVAGFFDVAANGLFLAAARQGLLTLVGVVGAMYPASTVLLARFVLHERLARHQLIGLGLAAFAVAVVTAA